MFWYKMIIVVQFDRNDWQSYINKLSIIKIILFHQKSFFI